MIVAFLVDPVRRFGLRRLRLATGLILFTYVGLHLADHALGNISLEAMEAGLVLQKLVWQGWVGTFLLYSALTIHFGLGLYAFYERRHYGWTSGEIAQVSARTQGLVRNGTDHAHEIPGPVLSHHPGMTS